MEKRRSSNSKANTTSSVERNDTFNDADKVMNELQKKLELRRKLYISKDSNFSKNDHCAEAVQPLMSANELGSKYDSQLSSLHCTWQMEQPKSSIAEKIVKKEINYAEMNVARVEKVEIAATSQNDLRSQYTQRTDEFRNQWATLPNVKKGKKESIVIDENKQPLQKKAQHVQPTIARLQEELEQKSQADIYKNPPSTNQKTPKHEAHIQGRCSGASRSFENQGKETNHFTTISASFLKAYDSFTQVCEVKGRSNGQLDNKLVQDLEICSNINGDITPLRGMVQRVQTTIALRQKQLQQTSQSAEHYHSQAKSPQVPNKGPRVLQLQQQLMQQSYQSTLQQTKVSSHQLERRSGSHEQQSQKQLHRQQHQQQSQRNDNSKRRMATGCNVNQTLPFVQQARYWFENSYPNWREVFNASPDQRLETICIPDAIDVLPNRQLENHNYLSADFKRTSKRNYIGQAAEDTFFHAFRKLRLGGVLISGFNTDEFMNKMNKEKVIKSKYKTMKNENKHFECDAIFLHHQLGAFIVEIKGCDGDKIVEQRFSEASNQLDKIINGMKEIYLNVTGDVCSFHLNGVICMPNAILNVKHDNYKILGKTEIESTNFKRFWFPHGTHQPQQRHLLSEKSNEPITDKLFAFISTIIGYRSAKFVSISTNAFEIYRMIDQQKFKRVKMRKTASNWEETEFQSMKADSIIMNKEQLSALECTEKHIIISGPPGTGKTTIMLLRALEAAKLYKRGRVIIVTGLLPGIKRYPLKSIFQKFIANNRSDELQRIITVNDLADRVLHTQGSLEDDIFIDEMPADKIALSNLMNYPIWRHMSKELVTGTTTIVITGMNYPHKVATNMKTALSFFPKFHHIELKTVIRGTLSIINEWQRFFPDRFISNGHNIKGAPVERKRITVSDRSELLSTVEQIVRKMLNAPSNNFSFSITPQHISVLVARKKNNIDEQISLISDIKRHISRIGSIQGGNFVEQVYDGNFIAVGDPQFALSIDWPIVIFISGDNNSDDVIALSRCISKLIIIDESTYIVRNQ